MTDAEINEAFDEATPLRWRDQRVTIAGIELDGVGLEGDKALLTIARILVRGRGLRGEVEARADELFPEQ